jgi:hypothetical protein
MPKGVHRQGNAGARTGGTVLELQGERAAALRGHRPHPSAQLSVPITSIFDTLQVYLGSYYVNDFNKFGRVYQVRVQADGSSVHGRKMSAC